jgi:uncharacterized protein YecT (DUF1311 family)
MIVVPRCLSVALLAGILLFLGAPLAAAAAPTTTTTTLPVVTYNRSCESTALTQIALDECAVHELKQLRGQLATALATDRRRIRAKLVNASQKVFNSYEHAECLAAASVNEGGTIYPLIVSECEIQLTVQRIQQVETDARYALS